MILNSGKFSKVRYEIISGDKGGNFSIDSTTGEIRPRGTVDFELANLGDDSDARSFNLTVRAYDLGDPTLFSDVPVTIYVTDENDHEPIFDQPFYMVC